MSRSGSARGGGLHHTGKHGSDILLRAIGRKLGGLDEGSAGHDELNGLAGFGRERNENPRPGGRGSAPSERGQKVARLRLQTPSSSRRPWGSHGNGALHAHGIFAGPLQLACHAFAGGQRRVIPGAGWVAVGPKAKEDRIDRRGHGDCPLCDVTETLGPRCTGHRPSISRRYDLRQGAPEIWNPVVDGV
jgi:hypothetical protein